MKKFVFPLMIAAMAFIFVGCNNFKSEVVSLNENLFSFTEKGPKGEVLMGVKENAKDDEAEKIIVQAGPYTGFIIDNDYIIGSNHDDSVVVFDLSGQEIGTFDSFSKSDIAEMLYIGTKGDDMVYIMKHATISTKNSLLTPTHLFLEIQNGWRVYDFEGNEVFSIPEKNSMIVYSESDTHYYVLTLSDGKKPFATIFDASGNVVRRLTPNGWAARMNNLENRDKMGTIEVKSVSNIMIF